MKKKWFCLPGFGGLTGFGTAAGCFQFDYVLVSSSAIGVVLGYFKRFTGFARVLLRVNGFFTGSYWV